jgi:hypothetical protein
MREVHLKYVQLGSVVEREGRVRRLGARFGVSGIWYLRREHDPHSAWWGSLRTGDHAGGSNERFDLLALL